MFLFVPPAESATKLLDASMAAHAALGRYRAHVVLDARMAGNRQQSTYDLAIDGENVLLRVRQPRKAGEDKSDRTFFFTATKMVAYDALANERLTRNLPKLGSRLDRVLYVFGSLPDLMRDLLQPSEMKSFFAQMKQLPGWTVVRKPGKIVLSRRVPGQAKPALIVLGSPRPLVRRLDVGSADNEVHWTFDYSPGSRIVFNPPASARSVGAFTVAPEPPRYATKEAERVTKAMLDAYARLSAGRIEIDGTDGQVRIAMNGRKFREDRAQVAYAYDGKNLMVYDRRTKAYYRGSAIRSTVPDLVADIAGGTDALSRQILQHRVPFREAIRPNMRVSIGGQIDTPSGRCDILSLEGARNRVTMFVRRKDHLLDGIMTTIVDGSGRMLASSNRRFRYTGLGVAPAASLFTIDPKKGQRVLPLPPVKIGAPSAGLE